MAVEKNGKRVRRQNASKKHEKLDRNFESVIFGDWSIKTWYFSPYPVMDNDADDRDGDAIPQVSGLRGSSTKSHGMLWVCDKCFKYMSDSISYDSHRRVCPVSHPPGRRVYQDGSKSIWEVDGAKSKLYCQNLSLFGKLFIDIKTLFFDCDNFLFYIVTETSNSPTPSKKSEERVEGFFSKEKHSYDGYNLATIVILPPFQRRGLGMLLIEFSYELSRRCPLTNTDPLLDGIREEQKDVPSVVAGTPERPLSDLGLRSFLAYWVATLVRALRRVLAVLPPDVQQYTGFPSIDQSDPSKDVWECEKMLIARRTFVTTASPINGSARTDAVIECTLEEIARLAGLRIEDASFAMHEVGLLARRLVPGPNSAIGDEPVVLSREIIEAVARARRVKEPELKMEGMLL